MLDRDAMSDMLGGKQTFAAAKFLKHFRQSLIEVQLPAQLFEFLIGRPIHLELVAQHLHVSELVIVAMSAHQFRTTPPENLAINPKRRKHDFVLHIARTQRLIVIVDDGDGILRRGHCVKGWNVKPLKRWETNTCCRSPLRRFDSSTL